MNLQFALDRVAIGLSLLCAIHCIFLPLSLILIVFPVPLTLDDEVFHKLLLVGIIPISLVALTLGCRKHKQYRVYLFGVVGLLILGLASFLGHDHLGELGEKTMTAIGGVVLALGHFGNYRLCRQQEASAL